MDFDFSAILVLATFVTGIVWLIDALAFKPKRNQAAQALAEKKVPAEQISNQVREPILVEYARSFFPVILAVLVLRSFLVEPFRIPSGSMMPTLLAGDFILVNKFAYGVRLPVLNTKIIELDQPQRGDVAVFRFPGDPSMDYIKRIIGLPGDTVSYKHRQISVNGEPVVQTNLGPFIGSGIAQSMVGKDWRIETSAGSEHEILIDSSKRTVTGTFIVPEGEYFVMGDNRDNSNDSRYWGGVPEDHLVGKAFMIWMNWDSADGRVSWERIGNMIK